MELLPTERMRAVRMTFKRNSGMKRKRRKISFKMRKAHQMSLLSPFGHTTTSSMVFIYVIALSKVHDNHRPA